MLKMSGFQVLNDDQEKGLIENEEENPEVKKKKKSLGSIKYKVRSYSFIL